MSQCRSSNSHGLQPPGRERPSEVAIVVLGSLLAEDGSPLPPLLGRLQRAVELGAEHSTARIIVTGGAFYTTIAEAVGMQRWLVEAGVAPGRILVEDQATCTLDNAELVAPLIRELGVRQVLVITQRFHVRRGVRLMRGALRRLRVSAEVEGVGVEDGLEGMKRWARTMRELGSLCRDLYLQRRRHARLRAVR